MGNPRGLAGIVRAGNDATLNLDVADANARLANQRAAMGYRGQMGQQQLAKQQWDRFGKYQENAAAASALMGAGRQNVMGGLSELSQVGQTYMMTNPGKDSFVDKNPTYNANFNVADYLKKKNMPALGSRFNG
jgi:hypothetical protein